MVAFRRSNNDVDRSGEASWATAAWRSCCKAPSLLVDEQPHEQPLEAQQFIKGAPGKGVVSHE